MTKMYGRSNGPTTMTVKRSSALLQFIGSKVNTRLIAVIRWDEKAGLRTGCGVRSQVIDVLEAQIKGDRQ